MIGMFKTFAVVGALGASAFMANPARADHIRVGLGFSIPAVTYAAPVVYQPTYVTPAPVVTYAAPTYYTPGYGPAVTYVAPPAPTVVYAQPPVVYAAPAYVPVYTYDPIGPVYYGPGIGFNLGFGFGGHGGDFHGGGHRR